MKRRRVFAALNILNLSVGIASFGIMWLWLQAQYEFDVHRRADKIYQVQAVVRDDRSRTEQAVTPAPLATEVSENLAGIENVLRLDKSDAVIIAPSGTYKQDGIFAADTSFFSFFDFAFLNGDKKKALSEPYSVILSKSIALKYFGTLDVLDKSIKIFQYDPSGNGADFKVTGVIEDCPANSHFVYSMLVSFSSVTTSQPFLLSDAGWQQFEYYTYVLTNSKGDQQSLNNGLKTLAGNLPSIQGTSIEYVVKPLKQIHFETHVGDQASPGVSKAYLLAFVAIGFAVLIFASINYVNMSTAFALERFKEVGVRRALGSTKSQLALQSIAESLIFALVAMGVALAMLELAAPLLESILNWNVRATLDWRVFLNFFTIAVICGIVAGIYPAIILWRFEPTKILKGMHQKGTGRMGFRKTLISVQFGITVLLLVAVVCTGSQMRFIRNADLGFDTEHLIVISMNGSPEAATGYAGFANKLDAYPQISSIAKSNTMIGLGLDKQVAKVESAVGGQTDINLNLVGVDPAYLETYSIELLAGRNFQVGDTVDINSFLLNETAVRELGYTRFEDAVGRRIYLGSTEGMVIGVVRDFHHSSFHQPIEPVVLFKLDSYYSRITIKTAGSPVEALDQIGEAFKASFPSTVFDYSFVNNRIEALYVSEIRLTKILTTLSTVAIVMAVIGLFAVISFTIECRVKEIGIRKILGASGVNLIALLAREFLTVICVSCLIAMPLGWYLIQQWLEQFSFHISGSAFIVLGAGLASFVIGACVVAVKTRGLQRLNVLESLRSE